MRFVSVTKDQLEKLREGLEIISHLNEVDAPAVTLCLYGITSDPKVIDAVKEALAGEADLEETDIKIVGEVAVSIPLSSDIIYYLTGSGLQLKDEEVAYRKGGGNGVDTTSLMWAGYRPRVTLASFSQLALAKDDLWTDKFLQQYGGKTPVAPQTQGPQHPHKEITREGVEEHTPKETESTTTPELKPKVTSSLHVDSRLVEEFLD
jgi:hypothetical protein